MTDNQVLIEAIELAERICEEVTMADQNWLAIEHMAQSLAELAARAARQATPPEGEAPAR